MEKLVRDLMAERIPADELRVEIDLERRRALLIKKLHEELAELAASDYRDPAEYADVTEVLRALASNSGTSPVEIEHARIAKLSVRGGFSRGLVWTKVRPEEEWAAGSEAKAVIDSSAADSVPAGPAASRIPAPPKGETHVYCDGGCFINPGPGGWAAVVVTDGGAITERSGNAAATTNNRMELTAAIEGVMAAGEYEARKITIFVDSTYVRDGISKWITNWKKRNWKTADGEPVKNADLWVPLDSAVSRARTMGFDIRFEWIKGHSGNPGNERADQIATIETEKARKPEIAA